ncbi:hypothetical protein DFH06DRAFT_1138432 [Mycena polygramma]|nr:hypothetical protein DFH06DRAFT_1138432 [Mycena polygramma]
MRRMGHGKSLRREWRPPLGARGTWARPWVSGTEVRLEGGIRSESAHVDPRADPHIIRMEASYRLVRSSPVAGNAYSIILISTIGCVDPPGAEFQSLIYAVMHMGFSPSGAETDGGGGGRERNASPRGELREAKFNSWDVGPDSYPYPLNFHLLFAFGTEKKPKGLPSRSWFKMMDLHTMVRRIAVVVHLGVEK